MSARLVTAKDLLGDDEDRLESSRAPRLEGMAAGDSEAAALYYTLVLHTVGSESGKSLLGLLEGRGPTMARMVRKQICIDADLERRLEAMAGSRHVSQSEIVRDALSAFFDSEAAEHQRRAEAAERFLERGAEIAKTAPPGWKPMTREEAHERRHFR